MSSVNLQGLEALVSLMELYVQNNLLLEFTEINHIRELPKLMVVDLIGNPLCEAPDYRLYAVYSLRKLKVYMSIYPTLQVTVMFTICEWVCINLLNLFLKVFLS